MRYPNGAKLPFYLRPGVVQGGLGLGLGLGAETGWCLVFGGAGGLSTLIDLSPDYLTAYLVGRYARTGNG